MAGFLEAFGSAGAVVFAIVLLLMIMVAVAPLGIWSALADQAKQQKHLAVAQFELAKAQQQQAAALQEIGEALHAWVDAEDKPPE